MTPHERTLATVNRKPVDRVPVDVWLTPEVLESLLRHVGETDEYELYRKLGVDKIAWIFPGYGREKFDPNDGQGMARGAFPPRKSSPGSPRIRNTAPDRLLRWDDPSQLGDYPLWPDPDRFNYEGAICRAPVTTFRQAPRRKM